MRRRPSVEGFVLAATLSMVICCPVLSQNALDKPSDPPATKEKIFHVGHGVTAPRAIYSPDPQFTDAARKAKYSGTAVLRLTVTTEGTTRDVKILNSLTPDLDRKAVAAVKTWKFEPAMKDGKPVPVSIDVEVDFHLY